MTERKHLTRKQRGLGKYDAPLRVQFERGYTDFKRGRISNPFHQDTMQYREWERGFNAAYYERLKRVQEHEHTTTGSRTIFEGAV